MAEVQIVRKRYKKEQIFISLIFLLPALFLFLLFVIFPLLYGIILSLHKWRGFTSSWKWIGLWNYIETLRDPIFWKAFCNNFIFAAYTILFRTTIGLILALILNRDFKGATFLKTLYFFPVTISLVVTSLIWKRIYDPYIGLLNRLIQIFHPDFSYPWLGSTQTALLALNIIFVWKTFGFPMLIFFAALRGISGELREAAMLDGASENQINFYIIIPLIRPIIAIVIILALIDSFRTFALVYSTTQGGPFNATEIPVTYIYRHAFECFEMGKASAASWLMVVILVIISLFRKKIAGINT